MRNVILVLAAAVTLGAWGAAFADGHGHDQGNNDAADQTLFCNNCNPSTLPNGFPDKALYCGVKPHGSYTLHISAIASDADGGFTITFRDHDAINFLVPKGTTHSASHALGGVPGVDDVVEITASGGVHNMMVTALADDGANDPFDEKLDGAKRTDTNYCTRVSCNGTSPATTGANASEPGFTSAVALFGNPCL